MEENRINICKYGTEQSPPEGGELLHRLNIVDNIALISIHSEVNDNIFRIRKSKISK